MLNFPCPYSEELVYSTIARAGIHMGIVSPKQLLDEVFGNRHVIATVDLPNYLEKIVQLFPASFGLDVERLIYGHTLFPVYAPFTTESNRRRCLEWMSFRSQGAVHLALGVAASRVKQAKTLRYCLQCLQQQLCDHGEYFWVRQWQVFGAECCLRHGGLLESSLIRHSYHRHRFFAASPALCPVGEPAAPDPRTRAVARQVQMLLEMAPAASASYAQWSMYYQEIARRNSCNRGNNICYGRVKRKLLEHWSAQWLQDRGLAITDSQSCWLRGIFRKHRKSFSYLEHIVVLDAFLPESWGIREELLYVANLPEGTPREILTKEKNDISEPLSLKNREQWLNLLKKYGVNVGRQKGGGSTYAWLYRHDRDWLLETNSRYKVRRFPHNSRVDWRSRDMAVVRQLIQIRNDHEACFDSPRWSKRWYLSQLQHPAGVAKNLNKLSLTKQFLELYCEDISDYQIRRMTYVAITLTTADESVKRWRVLRMAGLSEGRLKDPARCFLKGVLKC